MTPLDSLIIAIVEGLTEFLPISSTGHMILTSAALGLENDDFLKTFEVVIQLGAILAIALMYVKRFFRGLEIYKKLIVAFIPTAIVGFLAHEYIKEYLFNSLVVSIALIIGGIILIMVDKKLVEHVSKYDEPEKIPLKNAFYIGLIQCISMVPGVSRAGATIVGGVFNGLDKKQATEFSFLLAVPTMFAASGYDLLKSELAFTSEQLTLLLIGFVTAALVAWLAVKVFLVLVKKYGFKYFGWYRIGIGVVFLVLIFTNII